MAKFEVPGIKEWDFMTVWIIKKTKNICRVMLLETKTLLSSNIFGRDPLNFQKIETDVLTYSSMPGTSNMAIFIGVFNMLFPFLAFFKL